MVQLAGQIVDSRWFSRLILGLIVLAAVIVGVETYPQVMARWGGVVLALDWLVLSLFIVEAGLKMLRHGRTWWRYFHDGWNVFDFTIVVVCLLPIAGHYAAVLRLARVLRAMRLISSLPKLQLLVGSLFRSLPSMGYVGLLLALLFYVYAVMGVALFRENDPVHFGNLKVALLTLFRVVTLEDWTDVMYIQMYGSDVYPIETLKMSGERPVAQPVTGALYFVSFVVLGTIIMLNLVIGVIVSSMQEAESEVRRSMSKHRGSSAGESAEAGAQGNGDGEGQVDIEVELAAMELSLQRLRERVRLARGGRTDELHRETQAGPG